MIQFISSLLILIIAVIFLYLLYNKKLAKKQFFLFLALIISILLFAKTLDYILLKQTGLDTAVNLYLLSIQSAFLTKIFLFFTSLFNLAYFIPLGLILILFMLYKKKYNLFYFFIISLGFSQLIKTILKIIINRARPEQIMVSVTDSSFPSGHALTAIIFFIVIIFLFKNEIYNKIARYLFIAGCIFLIIIEGFSRMYLQAHYLSDVLAGFAISGFWMSLIGLLACFQFFNKKQAGIN